MAHKPADERDPGLALLSPHRAALMLGIDPHRAELVDGKRPAPDVSLTPVILRPPCRRPSIQPDPDLSIKDRTWGGQPNHHPHDEHDGQQGNYRNGRDQKVERTPKPDGILGICTTDSRLAPVPVVGTRNWGLDPSDCWDRGIATPNSGHHNSHCSARTGC